MKKFYFFLTKIRLVSGICNYFVRKISYLTFRTDYISQRTKKKRMNSDNLKEKKLFIETYGCQMNVADTEVVASIMEMDGYKLTDNDREADAIFVNTCSIR